MAAYHFAFTTSGFPSSFVGSLDEMLQAWAESLDATITQDNIMFGQIGGFEPTINVGPWLDGQIWKVWNGTSYVPATLQIGDGTFAITMAAGVLTGNRTVTFQDDDGIVAYLDDVYTPRSTVILAATTTPNIDWSASNSFYKSLGVNNTPTMSNSLPGQEIAVVFDATGAFTVNWTNTPVIWPGATGVPVQTASGKDLYIFNNIAGTIYGRREVADAS